MKKPWLLVLLALAAAALSVFFIISFKLTNLMRSLPALVDVTMYVSLAVIAVAMSAALIYALQPGRGRSYVVALAVTLVAGGAPLAVDFTLAMIDDASERFERRAFETKFLSQFEAYKTDIAARIAAQRPFSPRETQDFVEFEQGSNLNYRRLPDHSPAAVVLLKQALDAKIVDPNARVKGPRIVDVSEEPLFVAYYKFYLQPGIGLKRVREREWKLFQMLIAGGANLDDPAASILKSEVTRETEPYGVEGYLTLK